MNILIELVDILSYSLLILTIAAVTGNVGYWASRWMKSQAQQEEIELSELQDMSVLTKERHERLHCSKKKFEEDKDLRHEREMERWPQAELERQRIRDRKEGTS